MVIHSGYPEFILFLYVHVASSDNVVDPREIAIIKQKMTTLFPEGTDMEKKLYNAIREYNLFDRAKINDLLVDSFAHFKEDQQSHQSRILDDLKAIIDADGTILPAEKKTFYTLRGILDNV